MGLADQMGATQFEPLAKDLKSLVDRLVGGMSAEALHAKRAVERIEALLEGQQEDIDRSHAMLQNHQSQLRELADEKEEMKGVVAALSTGKYLEIPRNTSKHLKTSQNFSKYLRLKGAWHRDAVRVCRSRSLGRSGTHSVMVPCSQLLTFAVWSGEGGCRPLQVHS
eukprot:SAG31_NODE_9883_length_1216_cov_1.778872_1_plen_166_part_00